MKLKLTFPSSYYSGNEKVQVIKTLRSLFGFSLIEAKQISELSGRTKIYEVKYTIPFPQEPYAKEDEQKQIEELIRVLRNNDVAVEEILVGFSKKIKELISDAVNEDEFQLAIDLINVYRDNFK